MNAKIVFYTGTGGTARAAECFRKFFEKVIYEDMLVMPSNIAILRSD